MPEYNLSKEQYYHWKMDPTGQTVFQIIRDAREQWVEMLVNGNSDALETARIRGIIRGMDSLLEFEVED